MMLIIAEKSPYKAAAWLQDNTSNNFCFKQMLELAQLICSTGISNVYKPVKQGKKIQAWILKHKLWTYRFYTALFFWCMGSVKCKPKTLKDLSDIRYDLADSLDHYKRCNTPKTAIFRYKEGYASEYPSNSELPFDICTEEYKKYMTEYKFRKEKI